MGSKLPKGVSLVLPMYNEEKLVKSTLHHCIEVLEKDFENYEIIVIDDGSEDSSYAIAKEFADHNHHIKIIRNLINLNQGISVQRGFAAASKEVVLHNGMDLPFPPEEIKEMVATMGSNDLVVVERISYSGATLWRKIISAINIALRTLLFPFLSRNIRDMNFVQLYLGKIVPGIMPLAKSPAFTTPEMIFRARTLGYKVKSHPCRFQSRNEGKSKLGKIHDILWTIYDMFRFRCLLWKGLENHEKPG